jgi:hypothetical protein
LNLREVTGVAVGSGNLGMAEWSERAIDRIAALGAAGKVSPLGENLFRWLYGGDRYSATAVRRQLVGLLNSWPLTVEQKDGIASYAMHEFSNSRCKTCNGAREAKLKDGEVLVCKACEGAGLAKVTNGARARGCGVDRRVYADLVERPLEKLLEALRHADVVTNVAVAIELGRGQR